MTTVTDQKKPPSRIAENIIPLAAIGLLILGLVFAKGAVFALKPLLKFAIPGAVAYIGWRWVKRKFAAVAGNVIRQKMEDAMRGGPQRPASGPGAGGGQVIDLCPMCGVYITPGHRCAPNKT